MSQCNTLTSLKFNMNCSNQMKPRLESVLGKGFYGAWTSDAAVAPGYACSSAATAEFMPQSLRLEFEAATVKGLLKAARAQECAVSDVLLSCWLVLLRRVTGNAGW